MPTYFLGPCGRNGFMNRDLIDMNLFGSIKNGRGNHLMGFGIQKKEKQKERKLKDPSK